MNYYFEEIEIAFADVIDTPRLSVLRVLWDAGETLLVVEIISDFLADEQVWIDLEKATLLVEISRSVESEIIPKRLQFILEQSGLVFDETRAPAPKPGI
ncbi:hypothetical protein [Salinarimonas sp.]|uniref:hypothetical protein n=1 Tax=Salinarimonas sp. TaxID=2766526 RepID=UPI003919F029